MKYIKLEEQILNERKKNEELTAQTQKQASDLDYIAMMCDVDLDTEQGDDDE